MDTKDSSLDPESRTLDHTEEPSDSSVQTAERRTPSDDSDETPTPEEELIEITWKGQKVEMPRQKVVNLAQQAYNTSKDREALKRERQEFEETYKGVLERQLAWEALLNDPANAKEAREIMKIVSKARDKAMNGHEVPDSQEDEDDFDLDDLFDDDDDQDIDYEPAPRSKKADPVTAKTLKLLKQQGEMLKALQAEREAEKAQRRESEEAAKGERVRKEIESYIAKSDVLNDLPKEDVFTSIVVEMHKSDVDHEVAARLVEARQREADKKRLAKYLARKEQAAESARSDSPEGAPPAPNMPEITSKDLQNGTAKRAFLGFITEQMRKKQGG